MVQFQLNEESIFSRMHIKKPYLASHRGLVGSDTWPNFQLVLKGLIPRLKSKLVLRKRPKKQTLSSASKSLNYNRSCKWNVISWRRGLILSVLRGKTLRRGYSKSVLKGQTPPALSPAQKIIPLHNSLYTSRMYKAIVSTKRAQIYTVRIVFASPTV